MEKRKEDYWGKFAHTFDEDQKYVVGEVIQRTIIDKLSTERDLGNAVEFGCGRGYYTGVIAKNAKRVVATDISDEMLEMARHQFKGIQNITFQKANCKSTDFPAEAFDTAVMINLIHVIEDPLDSLLECHRILKTGGKLVIASYTAYSMSLLPRIGMIMRFLKKWGKPLPYFNPKLSPDHLGVLLEKAAFVIEESKIIGDKTKALYLRARKE
jgi:ubiquinone/menaquinone biosynthesis C-methylase UbiE